MSTHPAPHTIIGSLTHHSHTFTAVTTIHHHRLPHTTHTPSLSNTTNHTLIIAQYSALAYTHHNTVTQAHPYSVQNLHRATGWNGNQTDLSAARILRYQSRDSSIYIQLHCWPMYFLMYVYLCPTNTTLSTSLIVPSSAWLRAWHEVEQIRDPPQRPWTVLMLADDTLSMTTTF